MKPKIKKQRTPPCTHSEPREDKLNHTQYYEPKSKRFLTSKQDDNYSACPASKRYLLGNEGASIAGDRGQV